MIARMYEPTPEAYQLEEILLAYGGTDLVWVDDPDIDMLLEQGELLPAATVAHLQMDPGDVGKCHTNSAFCLTYMLANIPGDLDEAVWDGNYAAADQQDLVQLWTGYVLEPETKQDGKWRSHSWVMYRGALIETTSPRGAYFGCRAPNLAGRLQYALENFDDPYDSDFAEGFDEDDE